MSNIIPKSTSYTVLLMSEENMQEIRCIILGLHQWPSNRRRCVRSTLKLGARSGRYLNLL